MSRTPLAFLAGAALTALLVVTAAALPAQDADDGGMADKAAMMETAMKSIRPSEKHDFLERFLGTWETETKVTMGGATPPAGEQGEVEFRWLHEGRWLCSEAKGTFMGMPAESFFILGYDNFKQSYVTCSVSTLDTAMLTSEGDRTRDGDTLITYGTLDEYLTGEHDKMVKYVWRFLSDDEFVMEVHDLPIGEHHTKVLEVTHRRK